MAEPGTKEAPKALVAIKVPPVKQYVCTRDCFMKHETERAVRYKPGQVANLKEAPKFHFSAVSEIEVDFATASEEVLTASTSWTHDDLVAFAKETYNINLAKSASKETLIKEFIDARFRNVDIKHGR